MVVSLILGIIIVAIIIFTLIKVVKNVLIGVVLIGIVLLFSYFFLGSIPSIKSLPIIGPYLPKIPTSLGQVIGVIKRFFYCLEVTGVDRDSLNRLLITVKNTGKMIVSNFTVYVDNKVVNIVNEPEDPLGSDKSTTIQTDWKKDFTDILVQTSRANATYSK